jgi:hypothetical protein
MAADYFRHIFADDGYAYLFSLSTPPIFFIFADDAAIEIIFAADITGH